ncbi:MAG: hypothetical protein HPY55_09275 [Firmicutes bacterium]|nr:hypothetical protein [Bacillota bacterium]
MLGWRARIGVLLPANNTVLEPEMYGAAPRGMTFHFTRMVSSRTGHSSVEGLHNMVTNVDRGAEELSIAGVDVVVYACLSTSLAVAGWEDTFQHKVARWTAASAFTAYQATVESLRLRGARRIAILCPYGHEIDAMVTPRFREAGFDVVAIRSLNVTGLRAVCNVPLETTYRASRELAKEVGAAPAIDALCILATDLRTMDVVGVIERDLGIPVVSTNMAILESSLGRVRSCQLQTL